MAKLYPPTISGIIPAFCGGTITVPFSMNKAVGRSEVGGFSLKIKTINNIQKEVLSYTIDDGVDFAGNSVTFSIPLAHIENYNVGQYYKLQLAYLDRDKNIGHYSSIGVVKYTFKPSVTIEGLKSGSMNAHMYSYTAVYNTKGGDTTEKMYNYRWILRNNEGIAIQDSGLQLHNVNNDENAYEGTETIHISRDFPIGEAYTIQFLCTTTNKLELKTPRYKITQRQSVSAELDVDLTAELDYDNGLVKLSFSRSSTDVISGALLLTRRDVNDKYNWEELKRFNLHSVYYGSWSFIDYTIEQGKTYQYSLQQYNSNGVYSNRILSNNIYADFEDAYLYDGQRQLCIRFNPKVSTYKRNIPEGKVDTIGSKYAYITRNGNVNYKEFALSGLISYQEDPDNLYMNTTGLGYDDSFQSNLVSENIYAERVFKNDVLDWLTDGGIKLLRTPAEGNYLVRLMNVALQPMDQLGRMLHSFSCNAYEMAEMTNNSLQTFGIINSSEALTTQKHWASIRINDCKNNTRDDDWLQLISRECDSIFVVDMIPGDKIRITFANSSSEPEIIQIGITGSYRAENVGKINKIEFYYPENAYNLLYPNSGSYQGVSNSVIPGIITFSYDVATTGSFGDLEEVKNFEVPCRQFIGKSWSYVRDWYDTHIINEDEYLRAKALNDNNESLNENEQAIIKSAGIGDTVIWHYAKQLSDIIECINDAKYDTQNIYFLRAFKREVKTVYILAGENPILEIDGQQKTFLELMAESGFIQSSYVIDGVVQPLRFFKDRDCTQELNINAIGNYEDQLEEIYLYEIREVQRGIDENGMIQPFSPGTADFKTKKNSGYYVDAQLDEFAPLTQYVIDGSPKYYDAYYEEQPIHEIFKRSKDLFSFVINGEENISVEETEQYELYDCSTVKMIEPNHGVIIEIGYPVQEKVYSQEKSSNNVKVEKANWETLKNRYISNHLNMEGSIENPTGFNPQDFEAMWRQYYTYLRVLTKALAEYKLNGGENES